MVSIPGRSVRLVIPLLFAVAVCGGCASNSSTTHVEEGRTAARPPRLDRSVLTRELMLKNRFATVYDAVAALRSMWLRPRGPESFMLPLEVLVYRDNTILGSVETLRTIQPTLVATVRFYDGTQATARWGVGHSAGVIHVSTWSNGAIGMPMPDTSRARRDTVRRDSVSRERALSESVRRLSM